MSHIAQQSGRRCTRARVAIAEAEPLYKRSLAIREKALGPDHPDCRYVAQQSGRALPGPGPLYRRRAALQAQPCHSRKSARPRPPRCRPIAQQPGRAVRGPRPLRRRRAALSSAASPSARKRSAPTSRCRQSLNNLAGCTTTKAATPRPSRSTSAASRSARKRSAPTTPMLPRRSTTWPSYTRTKVATPRPSRSTSAALRSARRRSAPTTPDVAISLNNLAAALRQPRPYAEAEPLYKRALRSARRRSAPITPELPSRSTTWPRCTKPKAATPRPSRSTSAASPFARRRSAPTIPRSPDAQQPGRACTSCKATGSSRRLLAAQHGGDHAPRRAWRCVGEGLTGKGEAARLSWHFWGLVKVAHRLARAEGRRSMASEMFETAQWAESSEAARPWPRWRRGRPRAMDQLAALVRERQDLVGEWQAKDKKLIAAKSEAPDVRKPEAEKASRSSCDDRCPHRRDRRPLRQGLSRLRRADEPQADLGRRCTSPASRRRGARTVPRHARGETSPRGDLHLGRHQDRQPLGALGPWHPHCKSAWRRCAAASTHQLDRCQWWWCEGRVAEQRKSSADRAARRCKALTGAEVTERRRRPSTPGRPTSSIRRCLARSKTS